MNGSEFRSNLKEIGANANNLWIISAYITVPATRWLASFWCANCRILCRLSVTDLLGGASDLEALKIALSNGWEVYFDEAQHSKIYMIDKSVIFIGSANLTSSGLGLHKSANTETMVKIEALAGDLDYIQSSFDKAISVDLSLITKMEQFIHSKLMENMEVTPTKWPEYIYPETGVLKVTDFPLVPPGESCREYIEQPELTFAVISNWSATPHEVRERIGRSKAYNWLKATLLEQESQQAWYGFLTAKLHDDLADDPAPYRREVKELLTNLLVYCSCYMASEISIERPKYSQLIKIKL